MIETVPLTVAAATVDDLLEQRDQARSIAVRLEQDHARAMLLLEAVTGAVAEHGSVELWQHPAVVAALYFIADRAEATA